MPGGNDAPTLLDKCWSLRKTRAATTLLKFFSIGGGLFLIVAGIIGLSGIIYGQVSYFVGSIYAILFGCIVLVVELRDKVPMISAAYQLIDVYLKFMTLQRGKGLFYLGVGLLVLYISPDGTSSWGRNNVAALFLAAIGASHTCVAPATPSYALEQRWPLSLPRCVMPPVFAGSNSLRRRTRFSAQARRRRWTRAPISAHRAASGAAWSPRAAQSGEICCRPFRERRRCGSAMLSDPLPRCSRRRRGFVGWLCLARGLALDQLFFPLVVSPWCPFPVISRPPTLRAHAPPATPTPTQTAATTLCTAVFLAPGTRLRRCPGASSPYSCVCVCVMCVCVSGLPRLAYICCTVYPVSKRGERYGHGEIEECASRVGALALGSA